jgi:membrane protein
MYAVLTSSLNAWIDHRAGSKGAALAFYALFSMTPILILAIAGAGYFFGAEAAQGEIIAQVEGLVGRNSAIAFGVIAFLIAVIYKVLPDAPLSWRDVWIGAAFTAGLFSLGKYAIGLYLGSSGVASSFGAAGSLIALLLWVYYSAQIFFLGAEFTRQYALGFGSLQVS